MFDGDRSERIAYLGTLVVVVLGLYLSSRYSYLLFHGLIEIVTIAIALTLFILTWNTRQYFANSYLKLLGIGYGFVAIVDLIHTFAYKGMGVFPAYDSNLSIQLWIVARYLQAATLFAAPFFVERKLNDRAVIGGYAVAVAVLVAMTFARIFPDCFIDGKGLTPFKIDSEYLITAFLLVSLFLLYRQRKHFNDRVFFLVAASIVCTAISEMAFTAYVSVYGFANLVGHFAKLAAFYLIYRAILVTGLKEPFALIFRDLSQAQDALRMARDKLEQEVAVRKQTEVDLLAEKARQEELIKKLAEAHSQLLQTEKLASIGQLAAGVAHEINNPIGFVNSNLGTLQRYMVDLFRALSAYEQGEGEMTAETRAVLAELKKQIDIAYLRDDASNLLSESIDGLQRVKRIVQDLKDFSHVDQTEKQWASLETGLDSTLNVVWNELKYKAEVVKEYGNIPEIECIPSQLNQVFMNLLINAVQAIEDRGRITLRTGHDEDDVWVEVEDTGKGIQSEHLSRIFDPFFTTKPVGAGTGLGLSLSYGIVQRHGGRIEVKSEPGKGSLFRVLLPRQIIPAQ